MDASQYIPRDKCDLERVDALIAAGPEAALPILDRLLPWLQDINWPVAGRLAHFLASVGEPLIPHLRPILRSDDDMWIYWILQDLVAHLPPSLIRQLEPELVRLADQAENDHVAFCLLAEAGIWEPAKLKRQLALRISAHEGFLDELRELEASLPEA